MLDRVWLRRAALLPLRPFGFAAALLLAHSPASVAQTPSPASAVQPHDDRDLVVRSLEYYRHGDCNDAEPLFEKILLHKPKDIATRKLLANCYLQEKKTDEAKIQFQLVLEAAPQDREAFQGLKASMGEIQKQTLLKQTLALESRAVTAEEFRSSHEFADAEKLIQAHQLEAAENILNGIVSRHPDSVPARQRLAEIYSTTKRFDKAAEMYQVLAERPKSSPEFLLRLAQNLEWDKNYTKAAEAYRLFLQKRSDSSTALLAMARILMQNEDYVEAPRYYRLYLQKMPQDTEARTILANMLLWSGHYAEAAPEFERLQATKPKDLRLRLSLAQCYQQLEQKEKALQAYQEVLDLDPGNPAALKARAEYLRYFDELPRQQAYAALERNDFDTAAKHFTDYSRSHPERTEMLLQIARVYSWARRSADAERYYEAYLRRAPQDASVMRELAQLEMGNKEYTEARKYYELLTRESSANPDDYEALLHTYTWADDLAGAQPVAKELAALEPNNADARRALSDFAERRRIEAEQKRLAERTQAEELAAAHRYPEAIAAYRRYTAFYGQDRQTELLIPRLYSWGKDYSESAKTYHEYLAKYPDDAQARLELANVENWSGRYGAAENDYRAVLRKNPHQVEALVGVAQTVDYQQRDPFDVRDEYLDVLQTDPNNSIAEKRLAEIRPLVAPALTLSDSDFADSDHVFRTVNTAEATFPLPGRIKVTPFYSFGYFRQDVADLNLTSLGNGAGGRFEMARDSKFSLLAEVGGFNWSNQERIGRAQITAGRTSLDARLEATYRPGRQGVWTLSYAHKDAVYDLTTVLALSAGIMEDSVLVSYSRPLSERVHFWSTGGFSHYTPGTLTSQFRNTQPRFSARLDYQAKPWFTFGYSTRISGFAAASPIYFSPTLYQTHGLAYTLSKTIARDLFISADGEFDYGRIGTHRMVVPIGPSATSTGASVNSFELAAGPRLKWRLRHGLTLQAGLRFSQGSAGSSLNAPGTIYRTGGAELSATKVF